MPRIRTINVAAVCRRYAKFMKELNIASWISRFGSLCNFVLLGVLIDTALAQQNRGSGNDMSLGNDGRGRSIWNFDDAEERIGVVVVLLFKYSAVLFVCHGVFEAEESLLYFAIIHVTSQSRSWIHATSRVYCAWNQ